MKADSRFTWFRMYSEVLGDRKLDRAASLSGLSRMEVLGAWTGILCLASDSPVRGVLLLTDTMPLTKAEIADSVGTDAETLEAAMGAFERLGMLALDGDGVYSVCQWSGRQYESDTSTGRVRKFRERQAERVAETADLQPRMDDQERCRNVSVTPQSHSRTDTDAEEEGGAAAPTQAPPKAPRVRDERLDHVAIQAIRSVTGRWPPKGAFDRVIREVGAKPDLKKMRDCYEVWVSRHNDPLNLDGWLFDWYFHGIREQVQRGARASPSGNGSRPETDEEREQRALAENAKMREAWAHVNGK